MKAPDITPQEVREAIETWGGGWSGKLADRYGLYRQLIEGWERSGRVPRAWRMLLKAPLRLDKRLGTLGGFKRVSAYIKVAE